MAAGGVLVGRGYVSIRPEFEGDWSRSVTSRASSAGKAGAGAFSKAFGAGMRGIGALAGVAIGANLASAAAGAAALAPALATAGAAAGALKIGLSGVGEALKAAFDTKAMKSDAQAAANATRAVESAQRGLANAQRNLADARVQAAERIRDAQKAVADAEENLARVVDDSARRQRDAQRAVRDAERDLRDAQRDAREAQASLTDARQEATRALQDMNQRLAEGRLDEREAVLRLKQAERELRAAQVTPGTTFEQLERLRIAHERAKLNLKEQREETKRLETDTAKANKAGVEGSQQMLRARERIKSANETVADRERALARAQEEARRTGVEAARDVADAQEALAEAQADVAKARRDGARQVEDAERAVAEAAAAVADAQAAAAAQTSQFGEAMAELAPNAQSFVRAVQGLAPAWDNLKLSVQNELFRGLDDTVTTLGRATIPVLQRQLTATAGVWNAMAKSAANAVTEMARSGQLEQILAGATENFRAFEQVPGRLVTAFGQLAVAAQPAFNALSKQMAGAITSFTDGIAKGFESGGLQQSINSAFEVISQFGTLLANVLGTVNQVMKAASDAGASILGSLAAVFGELRRVLATDEMQATMRALFASIAQIVNSLVPIIGAVVQAAVPLLAAIAQPIAQLSTAVGPLLSQLATVIGQALLPIVDALAPALVLVGETLVQMVAAVMPLLQPIAALIAQVISALAPALQPIVAVATQLVNLLVGPLTLVIQALTPALVQIAGLVAGVFQALQPMLQPLMGLLAQVAQMLAEVFAQALAQLMPVLLPLVDAGLMLVETVFEAMQPLLPVIGQALEMLGAALLQMLPSLTGFADAAVQLVKGLAPLIPVGVQLVQEVLEALMPILPTVADAFVQIATAVLGIMGPLGELIASVAAQLAPVLADIAPILGDFVGLLADSLAQILPPLAEALVQLVKAFAPMMPLFAQLIGMVLKIAAGVLIQLLPSIMQLVQAGVQLAIALLPLVPPLTQLIILGVRLAVVILSRLLPPLLQFAGFLIGKLAGAISTTIGWVTKIISVIARLVGWVTTKLSAAFTGLKDRTLIIWRQIQFYIYGAWLYILRKTLYPIRDFFTKTVPGWGRYLRDRIVGAFVSMGRGFLDRWNWIKRNVLNPIKNFFTVTVPGWGRSLRDRMVNAFAQAATRIRDAFAKIRGYAKKPVQYVVDIVYNNGIRKVWNLVTDAFGGKHLKPMKFATGGVMPGYTPGRDVHLVPSVAGPVALSGGEAIMRPEWTRAVGAEYVHAMNAAARRGGVQGVRSVLGFADGGIFSGIGDLVSKGWDKVKAGAKWLKDTFGGAIKAGVKSVINPLISKIPGGNTGFVGLMKDLARGAVKRLLAGGKEGDKRATPTVKYSPSAGVEQWRPVVLRALREVGQSAGHANRTLRRMQQESGGNPKAVNKWDINWQLGHPSVGLMQVIGPTFRSYAGKYRRKGPFMYGVSIDPLANIYSSMRYALSRYGSLPRAYDRAGGYDAGGWLPPGVTKAVNLTGKPEAVLTNAQWRTMQAAATSGGGLQPGDRLLLVVDGHEFHAYVDPRADGRVQAAQGELIQVLNAG